jgi:phosphoenolpyruvate synthase/pyruvate phosphate dikinase
VEAGHPPEYVGGDPVSTEPKEAAPGEGALKGVGASRGTVTGTARVITDLCDADRLEVGDVLVCAMTSPPWTPLFGVAAAVVVDSGDLQSHPGIAAREYGIPCVLGTGTATAAIPDGATVRVDGERGVVEVLSR